MNNYPTTKSLIANGQRVHAQIVAERTCPTKPCSKCGHVKPRDEFAACAKSPDGKQSRCKLCTNEHSRAVKAQAQAEARMNAEALESYRQIVEARPTLRVVVPMRCGIVILAPRAPGRLSYRRHDPAMGKAVRI